MSPLGTQVRKQRRLLAKRKQHSCLLCCFRLPGCPREESDLDYGIRNPEFYPLNYEGK